MVSNTPFDVFDYPYPIYAIKDAPGEMDQTTGEFILGSAAETRIYGNLETLPMDLDERPFSYEGPIVNNGNARLHTETKLKKGDRIKVAMNSSDTEHIYYRVVSLRSNYGVMTAFLGSERFEYELQKEDESAS